MFKLAIQTLKGTLLALFGSDVYAQYPLEQCIVIIFVFNNNNKMSDYVTI